MTANPVSRHVNSPKNDDPECIAPVGLEMSSQIGVSALRSRLLVSRLRPHIFCDRPSDDRPQSSGRGPALIGVGANR